MARLLKKMSKTHGLFFLLAVLFLLGSSQALSFESIPGDDLMSALSDEGTVSKNEETFLEEDNTEEDEEPEEDSEDSDDSEEDKEDEEEDVEDDDERFPKLGKNITPALIGFVGERKARGVSQRGMGYVSDRFPDAPTPAPKKASKKPAKATKAPTKAPKATKKPAAKKEEPEQKVTYENWHKDLAKRMWKAVRRSKSEKRRAQYQRLLSAFRKRQAAWAKRKQHLQKLLQAKRRNKRNRRIERRQRRERLRSVARAYRKNRNELRSRYEQNYRRYLKLVARFFRRKYKVMVVEYLREHRTNSGLKKALEELRGKLHNCGKAKELFAEVRRKNVKIAHWKRKAQSLRILMNALERTINKLRAESDGDHKKLDDIMAAHNAAKGHLLGTKQQIDKLQKEVDEDNKLLKEHKDAINAGKMQLDAETKHAKLEADEADRKLKGLQKELKDAMAKHSTLSKQLQKENEDLKNQVNALKSRCVPDVCGKCNGDESSCAKKKAPETCHAVGDPHYRSFDGYSFDYQVTGEFILARHLNDFEVQNLQSPCPNPMPRCNKGMAVRGGTHIVVVYASWGTGTILVDGQKVRTVLNKRIQVDDDLSYTAQAGDVEVRYKDSIARAYIRPWANTHYMDLFVTAPGRYSSGRSMSGLCGTFNGNADDDRNNLGVARQFWVEGTTHSLFKNPSPRTMTELQEEDLEMTQAQKKDGAEKPDTESTGRPVHNIKLAFKDAAQKKLVKKLCNKGLHGWDRVSCEFDVLAGEPAGPNRHNFQMAQILDHEKMFFVCEKADQAPSVSIEASRIPASEKHEGFSYAFWFKPEEEIDNNPHSLIARGNSFAVNTVGANLVVRHGGAECQSPNVIAKDKWIQVVLSVKAGGSVVTYVNGKQTCSEKVDATVSDDFGTTPLVVVDKSGGLPAAKGMVARFFYLPLSIREKQVERYSNRRAPQCSAENAGK